MIAWITSVVRNWPLKPLLQCGYFERDQISGLSKEVIIDMFAQFARESSLGKVLLAMVTRNAKKRPMSADALPVRS
jgi:hypothetical protein